MAEVGSVNQSATNMRQSDKPTRHTYAPMHTSATQSLTYDIVALVFDRNVVSEVLGVISFGLIQNLVMRMDSLNAQLFSKVRSYSRDVGQWVALVDNALDVGVGVATRVDGVNHICDVETYK